MTSRERVLTAARREAPDRIPRLIPMLGAVAERLQTELGVTDLQPFLRPDFAELGLSRSDLQTDFSRYFTRPGVTWDEWGRGRIWDDTGHYAEYLYPLEKAETVAEIEAYPWPDLTEPYRWAGLTERVAAAHAQGLAVSGMLAETVFEVAWQLRSMMGLFGDILADDPRATVLLDKITDRRESVVRAYAQAGVDIIHMGDDVAMQDRLLMSRDMFNTWFRPRFERIIRAARTENPEVIISYHSDGRINDLIPDLLEAGVQILNPVQPECVDHAWVKATYGDRLAFSGGLGVQSVLPFGTPEEVREHTRAAIQTLGAGGGYIVGPSHVLELDTPMANIRAMMAAIEEFGGYD
jgi:uroporphyrinogen decarboxylase